MSQLPHPQLPLLPSLPFQPPPPVRPRPLLGVLHLGQRRRPRRAVRADPALHLAAAQEHYRGPGPDRIRGGNRIAG
eukprot:7531049-Pyramimonas_sp.AAC.1